MREKLTTIAVIEDMVDYILRQNSKAKPNIVYLMVLKNLADIVSRGRVFCECDDDKSLLGFCMMLFSRTGGGKDRANNALQLAFFSGATEVYEQALENAYKHQEKKVFDDARKNYPEEKEKIQRDYYIKAHTPRMVGVSSDTLTTPEGYVADRLAVSKYPFGSISVIDKEFGDTLESFDKTSKTLFTLMKTAWENGETSNKSTKGEKTLKQVKGVPMTLLSYSTVKNFKKTKAGDELLKLFNGGWLRRSLIAYDTSVPIVREAPVPLTMEEYKAKKIQLGEDNLKKSKINEYFGSLQDYLIRNAGLVIKYSDEAGLRFVNYEREMGYLSERQFIQDNDETMRMADFDGRAWQVFRLAGLLAITERKKEVDLESLENAINIVAYFSKQALQLIDFIEKSTDIEDKKDYIEELFEKALEQGFFNITLINKKFKNANKARKNEIVEELQDYAFEQGYNCVFQKSKKGGNGGNYMIEKLPRTEDVKVTLSLCADDHHSEGYKWVEGEECTLETAIALTTCGNYSAGKFKDEHRSKADWLGENTMLIFDVDTGTTIEEAKSMFLDTACAIMPTKSHQKEKNGVVCDRFRVFLPLATPIDFTDAKQFTRIMNNVAESFNLSFDTATADPSRMFYRASDEAFTQTWFSEYALHFVDWRMFDYETMGEQQLNQVARMHNATFRAENKSKEFVEKCVRKLCQNRYHDGNRNNTLFRALRWCKDAGFTQAEAESLMLDVTSSSPLPVDEWKTTVRSAWR